MAHYLLTGAGFSRNWGGWLADEAFEYLLGAKETDDYLRKILWEAKLQGRGFEGALSVVQGAYASQKSENNKRRLDAFTDAVIGMFNAMQQAFNGLNYLTEELSLQGFLGRFDAIFTLNQDMFLETVYAGPRWTERWYGSRLPYMKHIHAPTEISRFTFCEPMTQDLEFRTDENYQSIYKLHGSVNWFAESQQERLVVIGGNKTSSIAAFQVLAKYQNEFQSMLSQPDSYLMIIGYGFGDYHINKIIQDAALNGLKIFIVDTLGVDVFDKRNSKAQITQPPTELMEALMPQIIGGSRRSLKDTLSGDSVEYEKVMSFFNTQKAVARIAPQITLAQ